MSYPIKPICEVKDKRNDGNISLSVNKSYVAIIINPAVYDNVFINNVLFILYVK